MNVISPPSLATAGLIFVSKISLIFLTTSFGSSDDDNLSELLHHKVAEDIALPERQLIVVDIEGTSTSCGYGVPVMSFEADRTIENRGRLYKQKKILK